MDEYNDKYDNPIKEGLYVSEIGNFFRIRDIPQTGLRVTGRFNPGLCDSLTPDLASKLIPLPDPRTQINILRIVYKDMDTANWLEKQAEEISAQNNHPCPEM